MKLQQQTVGLICVLALCGCGGGGSESQPTPDSQPTTNTPVTITDPVTYIPDIEKKTDNAESSTDLYVEPDFNFDTSSQVLFTFNVNNEYSDNTIIKVYRISNAFENNDTVEDDQKELLFVKKVDVNGYAEITQDLPPNTLKVLATANIIGKENNYIKAIDANTLHFEF